MANISSGILGDSNLLNLKEIPVTDMRSEVASFFVNGEQAVQCFKTVRDQVFLQISVFLWSMCKD